MLLLDSIHTFSCPGASAIAAESMIDAFNMLGGHSPRHIQLPVRSTCAARLVKVARRAASRRGWRGEDRPI